MHSSATAELRDPRSLRELKDWLGVGSRRALLAVRDRPPVVTVALIACIVTTFVRFQVGAMLPPLAFDTNAFSPRGLAQGHLRAVANSTVMTRDVFMLVSISLSLLVTLGTYEVLVGHVRAAALGVVAAYLGPLSVTAGLGMLVGLGSSWADTRLGTLDIGASPIIAMASGAVAGTVRDRRLTLGLVLFLLGGLIVHHRLADWEHVLVFPFGYLSGRYLTVRNLVGARSAQRRSSLRRPVCYVVVGSCLLLAGCWSSSWLVPPQAAVRSASGAVLSPPRVVDTTYPAPSLGGSQRRVEVLLPAGYDNSRARFPVIELLHGHPGQPDDLFSLGDLQHISVDAGIAPFIAVIPDGNGPRIEDSWFANVASQRMGSATSIDVRQWAKHTFRTNSSWSYAGLSSGGFGAAYLPMVDTAPVHAICGLSGYYNASASSSAIKILAHADAATRRRASPIYHLASAPHLVVLAYGRGDARTERQAVAYATALRRAHHRVFVHAYPGKHQWSVWRPAFRDCFRTIVARTSGP